MYAAEAHTADRPTCLAAEGFVAAALGHQAEFLHLEVYEFTGPLAFMAADRGPGRTVEPVQPVESLAVQDAGHGRGEQPQDRPDPNGTQFAGLARVADPPSSPAEVRCGIVCGRLGRSCRPSGPSARQRRIHL